MKRSSIFLFLVIIICYSCSSTKNLKENEYMVVKNNVEIKDIQNGNIDNLSKYLRPIPNKKFMGIFPIKTCIWANFQPKIDPVTLEEKDSKFRKWMRKKGEAQVLYDSNDVKYSLNQLKMAMFQQGFFNSSSTAELKFKRNKKVKINYFVTANNPYFINKIEYKIDIPEYKEIIVQDIPNSLIKSGERYNEELLSDERDRIANLIRDHGYYFVSSSIVTIEVDTNYASSNLTKEGYPTANIHILVNFDEIQDPAIRNKYQYKYFFDKVYIYTNYDVSFEDDVLLDSLRYIPPKNKKDPTYYLFYFPMREKRFTQKMKIIKDYKSNIICDAIYTKKGGSYSHTAYDVSYRKLRSLKNFSLININFSENIQRLDTVNKIGYLNTTYKLTRDKRHRVSAQAEVRTDRSNLSFTYINKNIFKGAEYMSVNAYGSVYYYNWLNSKIRGEEYDNLVYGEYGGSVTFDIPRLIFFNKYQKNDAQSYSTSIKMGGSYSYLFSRLIFYANMTYKWNPNSYTAHSFSPLDISTIDTKGIRNSELTNSYPESYQRKFSKSFLLNLQYNLNYIYPFQNTKNDLRFSLNLESSGAVLTGLNLLFNKEKKWQIFNDFNYTTYEKADFNMRYSYKVNANNAIATRFNFGVAVPFTKDAILPFEKSFYVGGANSMRGWSFRSLGPGGYSSKDYIERSGDIKIEVNLEYQGTIYKSLKYGIFTDIGNVWLATKYEGMENAEFSLTRFYKELGFCVGAGLRIDFNFFIVRLDYGVPLYDPSIPEGERWINRSWKQNSWWKWTQGLQFGIGYAF